MDVARSAVYALGMPNYRCDVTFLPGGRSLPRDRCENVLFYSGSGGSADDLANSLLNIFDGTTADPGSGNTFQLYQGYEFDVNIYDMADAKPRPIVGTAHAAGTGARNSYPAVLASCLSFYATRNLPRQRGRIYIGPMVDSTSISGEFVPDQVMAQIMALGAMLVDISEAYKLQVYSRAAGTYSPVTTYWTDNQWDVMHSRELPATERLKVSASS